VRDARHPGPQAEAEQEGETADRAEHSKKREPPNTFASIACPDAACRPAASRGITVLWRPATSGRQSLAAQPDKLP
jgi:hypothetical protein